MHLNYQRKSPERATVLCWPEHNKIKNRFFLRLDKSFVLWCLVLFSPCRPSVCTGWHFLAKGELWGSAFLYWILSIHRRLWPTVGNGPGFLVRVCVFSSFLLLWAAAYRRFPVALQMWPCFFWLYLEHEAVMMIMVSVGFSSFLFHTFFTPFTFALYTQKS